MLRTDVAGLKKRDGFLVAGRAGTARPSRTLLDAAALAKRCERAHFMPSSGLAPYAGVAWTLRWQLNPGDTFVQHVIPDPCVQIIVEQAGAVVMGVVTRRFSATFAGTRFVFGLKFKPGGFRPFVQAPVSTLTNRSTPLSTIVPGVDERRLRELAEAGDGRGVMDTLEAALANAARWPADRLDEVSGMVDRIATDTTMLTVEQAAHAFGMSQRTLQRLLTTYVGVAPKWLIRLYRIKEAVARIEEGSVGTWADLALRLGYADQAHFVNDFRRVVGRSPGRHASARDSHAR